MKVNVTQKEIAPLWVGKMQPRANASAMSFAEDSFYSYNTTIAARIKNKAGETAYLLNSTHYSDTTSMHRNLVAAAIPKDAKVFYVPGVPQWQSGTFADKKRILAEMKEMEGRALAESETSRQPKKDRLKREANEINVNAQELAVFWR